MADIEFNCPKCQHRLVVDGRGAGKKVKCPKCSGELIIPTPEPSPTGIACPKCGVISPTPDAKFCMKCGANLQLSSEPVKCPNCSADLPLTQERYEAMTGSDIHCFKCNNSFAIPFDAPQSQPLTLRDKSNSIGASVMAQQGKSNIAVSKSANIPDFKRPRSSQERSCPYCGEQILVVAKKCKHCGEFLNGALRPNSPVSTPANKTSSAGGCLSIIGLIFLILYFTDTCSPENEAEKQKRVQERSKELDREILADNVKAIKNIFDGHPERNK